MDIQFIGIVYVRTEACQKPCIYHLNCIVCIVEIYVYGKSGIGIQNPDVFEYGRHRISRFLYRLRKGVKITIFKFPTLAVTFCQLSWLSSFEVKMARVYSFTCTSSGIRGRYQIYYIQICHCQDSCIQLLFTYISILCYCVNTS